MPTLTKAQRMSYRIGRGETGVLTFEPYKSLILPLWRFKNPSIALKSSQQIYSKFLEYNDADDFIGMDMCRKFLQMGMTRAKRYANHAGGRKYDKSTGVELEKSGGHKGMEEKEEASRIFRGAWERARGFEGYLVKKGAFVKEQKEWDRERKREEKALVKKEEVVVKKEEKDVEKEKEDAVERGEKDVVKKEEVDE